MADNPYVNKVEYGGQTLMDLTGDTATAADVVKGKTFHLASGAPAVGDGTFDAIIDVTELPVEDIEENVFYRLVDGYFVYNKAKVDGWTINFVDTLPSVGQPVTTDMVTITAYYSLSDGEAYGYIDEALSSMASIPVGWYPLNAIATAFDVAYGGVISNILDATEEDTTYLLLDCKYCAYKDGWRYFSSIGWEGTGIGAEVFNIPENTASGEASHAEGFVTIASGNGSHAEGRGTTASGSSSHAEGRDNTASGEASHAEGFVTTASGYASHAGGENTTASGYASHAEGYITTANHRSQLVFGELNVEDTSTASATERGNYVEIVGNGTATSARSNARTLDWRGNEVLAGKLTMGASPTANMDAATKQYVDNAVSSAGKSPVVYSFAADDWTDVTDESGSVVETTLAIPAAAHGITGGAILAQFWHQVSGAYLFNTWGCIESWAEIDASTHVITLHGPAEGYAGKVVLYG